MLTSLALFLASAQAKIKADPSDRQAQNQLHDYLKSRHINGVMLVNGKGSKSITMTNRETTNKREIVSANQLFPIASLQKIMTGTAIYQLK